MFKIRFRILIPFLFLINFSLTLPAQNKALSKTEITSLLKDAKQDRINGNYEESLLKSRVALEQSIKIKNNVLTANSYLIIASNFDELTEPLKALHYYNLGLFYVNKTNNPTLKNQFYNNLGNIYCFDKKQYDKGIYYYQKSLQQSQKVLDKKQIFFTKLNITWAYFDIGKYHEGLPYLKYINKYQSIFGSESTVVILNMLNGMYYNFTNENEKADLYFQKAIEFGNKGNEKSDLSYSHLEYSKFLNKIHEPQKAYENLCLFNKITEELHIEEKLNKANIVGLNLEIDHYKREIDKIETTYKNKQNLLIEEQSKNKKIVIIVFFILICTIISFYFFFQNIHLKHKNKLIDVQSKIQERIINASIDGQELERKKISTFLHDNISALLSSAGLHLNVFTSLQKTHPEEINKTKGILEEAHKQIRNLSHELMPALLVRFGLLYALEDLCEKTSNSRITIAFNSLIKIKKRYNEDFEMKLYFIIAELINNIIKHSNASHSSINIEETDSSLIIHVTDDGTGFKNYQFETYEGFGINQIRARINNMKGEFIVNSAPNKGTAIYLKVPVIK
ncbi:tetratricopeptide repeat-containing sensor histidine kinase [Flavobacterium sp. HJJ]|uniref:tetratricopeptide repeat-containing sensor histidine kinase n=1 Tax=Flavobacterium sp. HJJ TaxID=2783792 RepID=UPI00188C43BD|nr:tetratricopeptide repeat-containing sensor histidine kinase [Flavobacterium sp. HJJ]MBF4469884.1 two-component sensor histidine kinase [Flavobacterium sp. HJJ]